MELMMIASISDKLSQNCVFSINSLFMGITIFLDQSLSFEK